jgi:hypothetical protein
MNRMVFAEMAMLKKLRARLRPTVTLLAILLIAAALRFAGGSFGLRHTPFIDERFFVENVEGMLNRGDLDHRFHMYPGFFLYLLLPVLAWVPRPFGAEAYLLARQVVASFGVASVGLAYFLGTRLGGARAGLCGAAILAVSPVEVFVAHEVRPDVVLGFFALLALLVIDRLKGSWRRDTLCGMTVGLATAVKFTGVAVAASYIAKRLTVAGERWRGMLLAGVASVLTYAVLSPYSFLHFDAFLTGISGQLAYHTVASNRGPQSAALIAYTYWTHVLPLGLGLPALLLAAAGLWLRRVQFLRLLPLVVLPVTLVALLSIAEITRSRYLISGLGAVAVLAGLGLDSIWRLSRTAASVLVLVALTIPLVETLQDVAAFHRSSTMDRALDWIEARAPRGARVLTALPRLGLDRTRFEVRGFDEWGPAVERIATHTDVVVVTSSIRAPSEARFVTAFGTEPGHPLEGPSIRLLVPTGPEPSSVAAARLRLDASENVDLLPFVVDGDPETRWVTMAPQEPGPWVEARMPAPHVVDSLELSLGTRRGHGRRQTFGRRLEVTTTMDGDTWTLTPVVAGRPHVHQQVGGRWGPSQLLVFIEPTRASGVRITQLGHGTLRWGVAELTVRVLDEPGTDPP